MLNIEFKKLLLSEVKGNLNEKIVHFKSMLADLDESSESEEKSSSGDKYETGIEMIKQESLKVSSQLAESIKYVELLNKVNPVENPQIGFGSVVRTTNKVFFIAIPLGKIIVNNIEVLCISTVAPIAEMMKGKNVGDNFMFNNNEIEILELV